MYSKMLWFVALCLLGSMVVRAQSVAQIKKELETTPDPIGYVKFKLKKKYKIDTVAVVSTSGFMGIADSLAYKGKVGKVYGPFKKENILVKILVKAPNTFYRVSHILIDTAMFSKRIADSLGNALMARIKSGADSFNSLAAVYSSDRESAMRGGDLGWFVRGIMPPAMDAQIAKGKKGDILKVWNEAGLHIVKITDNPKKDTGFALMLRVLL
jgi:parvulin-like peptidyl-prolyl isomerase